MTATTLPRRAIALLLIAAAALFVLGVRAEGDEGTHTDEPRGEAAESTEGEEVTEAAEGAEEGEEREETVLGPDLESPLLVGAAVVVSILLAGLALARDRRLLLTVTVFAGAFAVLDIAEVIHQLDEDNTGPAVLAAVIAVVHAGAALLALQQASSATPTSPEHEPAST
jgi:hypothetical protein